MDREAALRKIKSCLALSCSANEHEAAAALRQAQKLMRENGISDEALQLADVAEASSPMRSAAIPVWECRLAQAVADAFGCLVIAQRGYRLALGTLRRKSNWLFIGAGPAAQVAAYAHEVLAGQCAKARLAHIAAQPKNCKPITKTARGDVFAKAWVYVVENMLDRFANGERNTELLEAYKAQHFPDLTSIKPKAREVGRNVKDDSYWKGAQAGRQADLKRGVGAVGKPELLT